MFRSTIALGLALLVSGCVEPTLQVKPENITKIQLSSSDYSRVQKAVMADAIDPESGRFGPFVAFRVQAEGFPERAACGWVNARNSFGGYVGWQSYVAVYQNGGWSATTQGPFDNIGGAECRRKFGMSPPDRPQVF
jgi:hypothetical protein